MEKGLFLFVFMSSKKDDNVYITWAQMTDKISAWDMRLNLPHMLSILGSY